MEIKRVEPITLGIILAIFGTLLAACWTALVILGFVGVQPIVDWDSMGWLLVMPLIFGLALGLWGIFLAFCYNFIALVVGGIVIELENPSNTKDYEKIKFRKLPEKIKIQE